MKLTSYIFLIILIIVSCNNSTSNTSSEEKNLPYELFEEESGISFEVFNDSITDENKYNYNNQILLVGRSFVYDFKHLTKEGETKYFEKYKEDDTYSWRFVDSKNPNAIKKVIISVLEGNPMAKYMPDYNQTCLSYKMGDDNAYNMSGGVENEANLWIHPPRDSYFKILELNPFPYVKSPYEIGTHWKWNLLIGSSWGDSRWKEWEGTIENKYNYEITGSINLTTPLGDLDCFIIEGKATSELGTTSLTSYFNETFGFVKLEYTNIDGSNTSLELVEVQD